MAVDFEEVSAEGEQAVPESSAGEGFASSGRIFDTFDASYNIFSSAVFFALQITVALEDECLMFDV